MFKNVVEDVWEGQCVNGWMGFVLKKNMKGLKTIIKVWNQEENRGMEDIIEEIIEKDFIEKIVGLTMFSLVSWWRRVFRSR